MKTKQNIKQDLRRSLLAIRGDLADTIRLHWDDQIRTHIRQHLSALSFTTLGVYLSIRNEPDLMDLYNILSRSSITLSLPVVTDNQAPLQFAQWVPGESLIPDRFGVRTPSVKRFISLPEVLLVPCLGFTRDRFRLGYGGGFYDRTLGQIPGPFAIGVSYSCLKVDFPVGEHDIAMHCLITEDGVF